jgi:hypothetical protein
MFGGSKVEVIAKAVEAVEKIAHAEIGRDVSPEP